MAEDIQFKIEDHSAEFLAKRDKAIRKWLEEAGLHLSGEASDELEVSPRRIDTGLLANSITYAIAGEGAAIQSYHADRGSGSGTYSGTAPKPKSHEYSVYIGTNVEYAIYVHEGTRRMTPNRFLKNALERNEDQLREKLEEALKGL